MKKTVLWLVMVFMVRGFAAAAPAAAPAPLPEPDVSIAYFKSCITPELGVHLAGYGYNNLAEAKLDDLYMSGLCVDDGKNKVLLMSFDLIGLNADFIQRVRINCGKILNIPPEAVLLSCTHTHGGPMSRSAGTPDYLNIPYVEKLEKQIYSEVSKLKEFTPVIVSFYSCKVDENQNRRYVGSDNTGTFIPHRREMKPIADEIVDKELGVMVFCKYDTRRPIYVIGNYAAHPLAGISPGLGLKRITADYPGAFRNYVKNETGAECMFITGASGNVVPKEDELGSDAISRMGINLGKAALGAIIDSRRNAGRFRLKKAKVGGIARAIEVPLRRRFQSGDVKTMEMEIQCVNIGDVCFVGVPGEVSTELGLEIKWHSPFRRTFIAYNSTAYLSYICPGNFLVSGGYEALRNRSTARGSLKMVNLAVDLMYELREKAYPTAKGEEPYPDAQSSQTVNIYPNNLVYPLPVLYPEAPPAAK